MKKTFAVLLCIFMVLAGLTGCGSDGAAKKQALSEETFIFVDDAGREVELPCQIERIIPSGSMAQIVLFAVAPEKFVGLAAAWDEDARGIIADEYYDLPSFGQFYGNADMNIEELAKVSPDVVIDIGEAKDGNAEDLENFTAKTGIPIVFIEAHFQTMAETYERLGELFKDKTDEAGELADFCRETYSRTEEVMEAVGDNKAKALYIQGDVGLNVLAKGSFHSEMLDMVVDNLAVLDDPSSKGLGNEVNMEQIALWNPEFIIFGTKSIYDDVKELPVWPEISAIANDMYVETPDNPYCWMGTPSSVQRYLGIIWLPAVLYPDYCDYDAEEEIKEYYRLFYHADLSDEQYAQITKNAWLK